MTSIWHLRGTDVEADHAEAIVSNTSPWRAAIRRRLDAQRETARMELEAEVDLWHEEAFTDMM